jgi:hypothetical protein
MLPTFSIECSQTLDHFQSADSYGLTFSRLLKMGEETCPMPLISCIYHREGEWAILQEGWRASPYQVKVWIHIRKEEALKPFLEPKSPAAHDI